MNGSEQRSFFIFYILGTLLALAIAGGVYYVWAGKQRREAQEASSRAAALEAGPSVMVVAAARGPSVRKLLLVGEALPYETTTLYSKVSGYLAKITVDVGDRVQAGQLIAEITSPEIDQQIDAATVALENKRRVLRRTQDLAAKGFFSEQALDTAETDVKVAESQLSELRTVSGYRSLRAPFAGVVTQRYADPGALVQNAATNQVSALPVVTISNTARLKVSVYVEQGDAPNVKPGLEAEIVDASNPQSSVVGKVTRTGGELDPKTRTLLTEVDFDNSKGRIVAGSFVNVSLLIPATSYVEAPSSALVSRDKKTLVAVVGADNRVALRAVTVAGTDGKVLRVAAGLNEGEKVVLNLPTTVADGGKINPAPAPGAPAAPPAAPAPSTAQPPSTTQPPQSAQGAVSQQPAR